MPSSVHGRQVENLACAASCSSVPVSTASCRSRNGLTRTRTLFGFRTTRAGSTVVVLSARSVIATSDTFGFGWPNLSWPLRQPDHCRYSAPSEARAEPEIYSSVFSVIVLSFLSV